MENYRDKYRDQDRYRDEPRRDEPREVYSVKVRAGKRTYLFDVRETRGNDFYITITERKRRFRGDGYQKEKIYLYKEDFNKFVKSLEEVIGYVKEELLPDYDFDQYDQEDAEDDWDKEDQD